MKYHQIPKAGSNFFFKNENWCAAKRVVNRNGNVTIGTQKENEIPRNPE